MGHILFDEHDGQKTSEGSRIELPVSYSIFFLVASFLYTVSFS